MTLIDQLRTHSLAFKPTAKHVSMDDSTTAVQSEWQSLHSRHFSSCPTKPQAAVIPRFHFTAASHSNVDEDHQSSAAAAATADKFRVASRHRYLQRLADRLLSDDELNELCQSIVQQHTPTSRRQSHISASVTSTSLDGHSSNTLNTHPTPLHDIHLSYTRFLALASVLPRNKRAHHINARTFALFPRTTNPPASISALLLLVHLLHSQQTSRLRLQLSFYDEQCTGHLTEEQLMNYIYDDMAVGHSELSGLDKDFAPFYVFTVIRKFMFFVDASRRGRMSVRELAHSSLLHEWEQRKTAAQTTAEVSADSSPMDALRQALALAASSAAAAGLLSIGATTLSSNLFSCTDPGRLNSSSASSATTRPSWFSLPSSQGVYALYLSLDRDQNGMLSQAELAHFQSGAYTAQLLDALFSTVALYPSASEAGVLEMDYKAFLDFVLAVEYSHTTAALTYWFRLLDHRGVGYLDAACVRYWYGGVRRKMQELGHEQLPSPEVVQSEVFDMVGPTEAGGGCDRITLRDLVDCKCGHTVVQILVNVTGFWRYDHRETLMQQQQQQQ